MVTSALSRCENTPTVIKCFDYLGFPSSSDPLRAVDARGVGETFWRGKSLSLSLSLSFVPVFRGGTRGIVTFNFSPRNLTQVTSTMKPGQDSMFGFSSVKRITLREGLY